MTLDEASEYALSEKEFATPASSVPEPTSRP